jgi:predicted transcriptional regulator of viral defense system
MNIDSHTQRLVALTRHKGVVRTHEVEEVGIPRVVLSRLAARGVLERVDRGLYRLADAPPPQDESLVAVAARVPQAVFCLLTALQFHELTTQLPRQVWIAMPRGRHAPRMGYPPLRMVQFSGDAYEQGVEAHPRDGVALRVYGVAKTVADCFKMRHVVGLDVALEALREVRGHQRASVDEIWQYAKVCRVANVMRPYLEAIG